MNLTGSFRLRNNNTVRLSEGEVSQRDSAYGTSTSLSLTTQENIVKKYKT